MDDATLIQEAQAKAVERYPTALYLDPERATLTEAEVLDMRGAYSWGYLAAARPTHKRIAELEAELATLKGRLADALPCSWCPTPAVGTSRWQGGGRFPSCGAPGHGVAGTFEASA